MKLSQRFSPYEIEYHKNVIEDFKKHPGCCDEVWLSTLYGYSSPEKHKRWLKSLLPSPKCTVPRAFRCPCRCRIRWDTVST